MTDKMKEELQVPRLKAIKRTDPKETNMLHFNQLDYSYSLCN